MKFMYACEAKAAALIVLCCGLALGQPKLSFDDFLKQHTTAIFTSEKDSLLSVFWRQALQRGIPWIDTNHTDVTFLYRGAAESVKVYGDFTNWSLKIRLKRLPDSDLWYLRLSFERDARLDYLFEVNAKEVLDPHNPRTVRGGSGKRSELVLPEFVRAPELQETAKYASGTMATLTIASKILGYGHKVHLYTPPGYDTSSARYPVVYFQDGGEYLDFADVPAILNTMIGSKAIPPLIAAFVAPPAEPTRNRTTEYSLNDAYVQFFTTELIPQIDGKYRTQRTADERLVVGNSYGGLISLYIGYSSPEIVANAASQSGYLSFRSDTLATIFRQSLPRPLRLFLTIGMYEKRIVNPGIKPAESNFLAANRDVKIALLEKEYAFVYKEYHDGHSWGRWRNEIPSLLRWFLFKQRQESTFSR